MPNSKTNPTPYLIVGQGLAGTLVSYQLWKRGIAHKVLDDSHKTSATKAAAGIINPVTGRRYVKSWMIDALIPKAKEIYKALEQLLGIELIKQSPLIRTWSDQKQEDRWYEATSREGYQNYIEEAKPDNVYYEGLTEKPYGYGVINESMQIKVGLLITAYRSFLIENGMLLNAHFDYDQLDYDGELSLGEREVYSRVVFCEGYKAIHNPLFSHLPFQPAKGEAFIAKLSQPLPPYMIRDKIFIAPQTTHTFWTGGGYMWDDLTDVPTDNFKVEWTKKLKELLLPDFEILEHKAGIRPSVKGRRPLIGQHENYEKVYLFNGLGTKGTSLGPYWSEIFIDNIEKGIDLPDEVRLDRF